MTHHSPIPTLVARPATDADARALDDLAALDAAAPLQGNVLVAELDGRLVAARSLADGRVVADPFVPTADARAVLAVRAAALEDAGPPRGRLHRLVRLAPARLRPV